MSGHSPRSSERNRSNNMPYYSVHADAQAVADAAGRRSRPCTRMFSARQNWTISHTMRKNMRSSVDRASRIDLVAGLPARLTPPARAAIGDEPEIGIGRFTSRTERWGTVSEILQVNCTDPPVPLAVIASGGRGRGSELRRRLEVALAVARQTPAGGRDDFVANAVSTSNSGRRRAREPDAPVARTRRQAAARLRSAYWRPPAREADVAEARHRHSIGRRSRAGDRGRIGAVSERREILSCQARA